MLAWFAEKLWWPKRRSRQRKRDGIQLSKWHRACLWLARSVDGVDMLLRDDGSIMVISKSRPDPEETLSFCAISRSNGSFIRSHLHVNLLPGTEDQECVFKTIECWSETLAKLVVNLISLPRDPSPGLDPPGGGWGIMAFTPAAGTPATGTPAAGDGLPVKHEFLFPAFKSEEELFMRMALDGLDINGEEDFAGAQG